MKLAMRNISIKWQPPVDPLAVLRKTVFDPSGFWSVVDRPNLSAMNGKFKGFP